MQPPDDDFKVFNRVFLSLFGTSLAAMFGLYLYMQPVVGELTRMGGFLENHFGWTAPQEHFSEPLFTLGTRVEAYDRPYDVVVIGDSFSADLAKGWQNYLAAATGWSIIAFNMNEVDPEAIFASPIYREAAPRLLIYQSVERNLLERFNACPQPEPQPQMNGLPRPLPMRPVPAEIERVGMDRYPRAPVDGLGISTAFNYLKKAAARQLNRNATEVHRFELMRDDLFSSAAGDALLVITRDFRIRDATPEQIDTATCGMRALQARIEGSGETIFVAAIVPDKTTAYAAHIADVDMDISIIRWFEQANGLHVTSLDQSFKQAIDGGAVDLYLPNDTHCGYLGYRLIADEVLAVLQQRQLLSGPPVDPEELAGSDRPGRTR
jgi:hypothetical protein